MTKIKLMADYGCAPLWRQPPDGIGNISLEALAISDRLRAALHQWAVEYDNTLDLSNPLNSGFDSQDSANAFNEQGYHLLSRLQSELGKSYEITYFSNAFPKESSV